MRFRLRDSAGSKPELARAGTVQPTPAELKWWAEERRPFRRRAITIHAAVFAALFGSQQLFRDPTGLLAASWLVVVPVGIGLVLGSAWLSWRLTESLLRPRYILGKRIRDEMLGGAKDG